MTLLINKLRFSGNLGQDAESRPYNSGKEQRYFVTFSVAQTRLSTDNDGKKIENTVWLSCKAFLKQDQYDTIFSRLVKGASVYLEGHLEIEKKLINGVNQHFANMVCKEFHFLAKPLRAVDNDRTGEDSHATPASRAPSNATAPPAPRAEEANAGAFMPANF